MSKESINLNLSLAPPNYSHLQSSPAVQESPNDDINLQESIDDRQLQLPSPAVQEPIEFTLIEVAYRQSQVLPFYNFFGPKNGDNTRIQEPPKNDENINLDLSSSTTHSSHPQSLQKSLQESPHGRQLQLPSPAVQKSIEFTLIEVPYRGPQVPFYNFFGPKNEDNTWIQEPLPPPQTRDLETQREIRALYPWAKSTGFEVHTLKYLVSKNITKISGEIMCRGCKKIERLEYNLIEKFEEVCKYIKETNLKQLQYRRALGRCGECNKYFNSLKPVISEKKEEINWLFLMLGQMLGCCRRDQLEYFCYKNVQRRDAAKDRLVYIAYVVICNQLDLTWAFQL